MKLRTALSHLPNYVPGRPAKSGVRAFKVSSNENPYTPMPEIVAAAQAALTTMNRYPDMAVTALHDALARRFDVPGDHLATGTGSVGLLQQFVQATCDAGDEVVFAWRAFEAYPIVSTINGAVSRPIPLRADESHDLEAMADAITDRTKLVLVCQPNNPTGVAATRAELDVFLERVPPHVLVVLDEAYVEFVTDSRIPDGLEYYRRYPNVAVLRTFSKAYGLAGLRIGYAISHSDVAAALRKCAVPFGVSSIAQAAALAALDVESELRERVQRIVSAREQVVTALRSQGWQLPDSQANFVWLRLGQQSPAFAAFCDDRGLAVRPYGEEGVRITVGEAEADAAFIETCAEWLAVHSM